MACTTLSNSATMKITQIQIAVIYPTVLSRRAKTLHLRSGWKHPSSLSTITKIISTSPVLVIRIRLVIACSLLISTTFFELEPDPHGLWYRSDLQTVPRCGTFCESWYELPECITKTLREARKDNYRRNGTLLTHISFNLVSKISLNSNANRLEHNRSRSTVPCNFYAKQNSYSNSYGKRSQVPSSQLSPTQPYNVAFVSNRSLQPWPPTNG